MRNVVWAVLLLGALASNAFADDSLADVAASVSSDIKTGKLKGVTGGIVTLNGEVLFEAYAPGNKASKKHDIRSATKSITALLVGGLIDEGKLKSTRTKLPKILESEFAPFPKKDVHRKIRIEDLLTMRGGLACNDWAPSSVGNEDKMYDTKDWFSFWINQPHAYEIGKYFSYCTGGVVALGRVIERLAGEPVPNYAEKLLFKPLGIDDARWDKTPQGYTDTGGHLRLSLRDLHKVGMLVADGGKWNGQQLVSQAWIEEMTSVKTSIPERRQKYGYLWWHDTGEVHGTKVTLDYAHGNGGNFILIVPELGLVAAFTGTNYGKPSQFTALNIFASKIVPAVVAGRAN